MRVIQPIVAGWEKLLCRSPRLSQLYAHGYAGVVKKEISLASITESDRVLSIGCGALPFTAIHAHRMTGARVIALDRDESAVRIARNYLQRLGLADEVEVVTSDAAHQLPTDFTVAIVALQAEPKLAIAEGLLKVAQPGARLVFRRPRQSYAEHYDCLPSGLTPVSNVQQDKRTFDASILFMKSSDSHEGSQ